LALLWQARSLKDFSKLEIVRPEQAQDLGGGHFRAEVKFGDLQAGYSDTRCHWDISQLAGREGTEWAFGLEILIPQDWIGWFPKDDELGNWPGDSAKATGGIHGGTFMEFHHAPNDGNWNNLRPGSAPFYLGGTDRSFLAYLLETDPASSNFGGLRPEATWFPKPIVRGQWTEFVVHVLWSNDPARGYIEVLADGQQVVPRFTSRTLYPNTFVYPQVTLYRRRFIGDPSLRWQAPARPGVTYPAGFVPAVGARVFPRDDGYVQSVEFRNLRIGNTVEDVMAAPAGTGTTTPAGGTATPAPAPAPTTATMSAAQKADWLKTLQDARDVLQAQAKALQASADTITAQLNRGTY
jgi:hypothetical protein